MGIGGIILVGVILLTLIGIMIAKERADEYITYVRRGEENNSPQERFRLVGEGVMKISYKTSHPSVTVADSSGNLTTYKSKSFFTEFISLREVRKQTEVSALPLV